MRSKSASAVPLTGAARRVADLEVAEPRPCPPDGSAPRALARDELGAGEHIERLLRPRILAGPAEGAVHGVPDRRGAELGAGCAERVLVDVDQVLSHPVSIYRRVALWPLSLNGYPCCRRVGQ